MKHKKIKCNKKYQYIEKYLEKMKKLVINYGNAEKENLTTKIHTQIIKEWIIKLNVKNCLDVGCGNGDSLQAFKQFNIKSKGIVPTKKDYLTLRKRGLMFI